MCGILKAFPPFIVHISVCVCELIFFRPPNIWNWKEDKPIKSGSLLTALCLLTFLWTKSIFAVGSADLLTSAERKLHACS